MIMQLCSQLSTVRSTGYGLYMIYAHSACTALLSVLRGSEKHNSSMSPKFLSQAQQLFCAPASQSRMHVRSRSILQPPRGK